MPRARTTIPGPSGVLRLTQVQNSLAHVLEHSNADEPTGTWTGLACPDHSLAIGSDVEQGALMQICAAGLVADLIWEAAADLPAAHDPLFAPPIPPPPARSAPPAHRH